MSNSLLKNKKSTYIMLPITLAIWGFIGYKIYQYMNQDEVGLENVQSMASVSKQEQTLDSFSIFNNYRDPFLGENGKELVSENKSKGNNNRFTTTSTTPKRQGISTHQKNNSTPISTAVAVSVWPAIVYNGMITNSSKQQSIGFISVNGVSNKIKVGDKIGDLKILDFNQNEVTILKGKEKKVFSK